MAWLAEAQAGDPLLRHQRNPEGQDKILTLFIFAGAHQEGVERMCAMATGMHRRSPNTPTNGFSACPLSSLNGIPPRYTLCVNPILVIGVAYAKTFRRLDPDHLLVHYWTGDCWAIRGCHESILYW